MTAASLPPTLSLVPSPVARPGLPLAGGPPPPVPPLRCQRAPPLCSETPEAAHPPPSEQDLRSFLSGPGREASLTSRLPSNSSERNQCSPVHPSTFTVQRKYRPLQEALPDQAQTPRGPGLSPRTALTEAFQNCLRGSLGPSGWLQEGPQAGPHQSCPECCVNVPHAKEPQVQPASPGCSHTIPTLGSQPSRRQATTPLPAAR